MLPDNKYDKLFRNLDIGDILGVDGEIFITKTGELSIKSKDITLLSKSIRPLPNLKEKDGKTFFSFDDKELRYRHRHLDLIANKDVREIFISRSKIVSHIRYFLDNNDYLEVETPILQPIYGGAFAKPFTTYHNALDQKLYLRIADELYLKRLIIGGYDKVYEIGKDFRNEGIDKNHNPEFTMIEFYEAYADVYDMAKIVEELLKNKINLHDNEINLSNSFKRINYYDAIEAIIGKKINNYSKKQLLVLCNKYNIDINNNLSWGKILDKIFSIIVEPTLIEPTFIFNYPKEISPLAKNNRDGKINIVERFELFIGGVEVANSFTELNDPIEQRKRLEDQLLDKEYDDDQKLDENFIEAMECGMPPTGGVGIGVDRLVMLLNSIVNIKDVILFPTLRKE